MNLWKKLLAYFDKEPLRPRVIHLDYYRMSINLNYEEDRGTVSGKNSQLGPRVKLGDYLGLPTSQGRELFEVISLKVSKNEIDWKAKVKWLPSQLCPNCLLLYKEENLVKCPKCNIELVWKD